MKVVKILLFLNFVMLSQCDTPESDSLSPFVIGGTIAPQKFFKFQLSLQYFRRHICGASVISTRFALTAAHCLFVTNTKLRDVNSLTLVGGITRLDQRGITSRILQFFNHPDFTTSTYDCDVAVLNVRGRFVVGSRIDVIPLSGNLEVGESETLIVSGWGFQEQINGTGITTNDLLFGQINKVNDATCSSSYGRINIGISSNMMCAVGWSPRQGACFGDSGGPLTYNGTLVGVVSFGVSDCASPEYPAIFSKIASEKIQQFIFQTTGVTTI